MEKVECVGGSFRDDRDNIMEWEVGGQEPPFPVLFTGRNGRFYIGSDCKWGNPSITVGDDCTIDIGSGCNIAAIEIYTVQSSSIEIGRGTGFTWQAGLYAHESFDIKIGRDCLIASQVWISVSDMHSIVDRTTGHRINPGASIDIADHVWIGQSVFVLKGAHIGTGSIIGAKSVVSGAVPEHCIAAGTPARVVRENVSWDHSLR